MSARPGRKPMAWVSALALVTLQLVAVLSLGSAAPARAAGAPGAVTFTVVAANGNTRDGEQGAGVITAGSAVNGFKWLVTRDDVGNPDFAGADAIARCLPYGSNRNTDATTALSSTYNPGDGRYNPGSGAALPNGMKAPCEWPSTRYTPGAVGVVASGAADAGSNVAVTPGELPAGKYLVSVVADGFKIDGEHFTVDGATKVTVGMHPGPTPLGAVRFRIFKDTVPVDGTYEADAEQGLGGFVGHVNDIMGEVSTDFYGNRLCTNYVHTGLVKPFLDANGVPTTTNTGTPNPAYTQPGGLPLAGYGRPHFNTTTGRWEQYDPDTAVVFENGAPKIDADDPGGTCFSDVNGDVVMRYLGPNRYTASVVSPQGQTWYQTNTLEGNHDWDIWIAEGNTGFDNELTVGAELVPPVQLGFVPAGYVGGAPRGFTVTSATAAAAPLSNLNNTASTRLNVRVATVDLGTSLGTATLRAGQQVTVSGVPLTSGVRFSGTFTIVATSGTTISYLTNGGTVGNRANPVTATPSTTAAATSPDAGPDALTGSNTVTGTVVELNSYIGGKGGVQNGLELNLAGANVRGPVKKPLVTLSDLGGNDRMTFVARFGDDGKFTIPNVPEGSYQLTMWDFEQNMIIDSFNVTVAGTNQTVDVGTKGLVDWWTEITGSVFIDDNENGKRDPGEVGVPQFPIALKERDNSTMDAGINGVQTDANGNYNLRQGYPITKWLVLEAFNTRYYTTGVTVQAANEKDATTYLGAGVDISVLPVIGLTGKVDWGVKPYTAGQNGGIAGTVTYDTTRNELSPADAATEPYQPGIPDMTLHLYYPIPCVDPATNPAQKCSEAVWQNGYQLEDDGSVKVLKGTDGQPLPIQDDYISETWQAPQGCTARDQAGDELTTGVAQQALPPAGDTDYQCVEAPMTGWQAKPSDTTPGAFGQTVNGNYAFASTKYPAQALDDEAFSQADGNPPNDLSGQLITNPDDQPALQNDFDYVVKAVSPLDAFGQPIYQPTREEDVNVFDGDTRMPQENYPLSQTDVDPGTGSGAGSGTGGPVSQSNGVVSECAGASHTVDVTSQGFLDAGGSPFQDQSTPLCDAKLIGVRGGQAVAPNFNFFTPVPLPTHFWGLTINDLGLSHDQTQIGYGEAQPMPGVPMGIYDYSGRLVDTVITDYNGMYEATEPSSSSYNCPLPAGPCPGMYYFKGNDPGQPGHPNPEYNPRFRTIGTNFQAWPGLYTVTDTAPTQVAQIGLTPGSTQIGAVQCNVSTDTPNLMSVSTPYLQASTAGPAAAATRRTSTEVPVIGVRIFNGPLLGTGNRTVRLTLGAPLPATGLTAITVPTLNATNAGGLSAAQRAAVQGPHAITASSVANWTVDFTVSGPATLWTPLAGVTTVPVSVNGASVPGLPDWWDLPVPSADIVSTGGSGRRAVLHVPTTVNTGSLPGTLSVPVLDATNAAGLTNAQRSALGGAVRTVVASASSTSTIAVQVANNTAIVAGAATAFTVPVPLAAYTAPTTPPVNQRAVTVKGTGFGTAPVVTLTGAGGMVSPQVVDAGASDTQLTFTVGTDLGAGVYQLGVRNTDSGKEAVNGLSFHLLGTGYNPTLIEVNKPGITAESANQFLPQDPATPGYDLLAHPETAIQRALDRAASSQANPSSGGALVVVWPGPASTLTPTGDYYENLIVHSNVKLQGVGPGGFQGSTWVPGTRINGLGFAPDNAQGANWLNTLATVVPDVTQVADAAVVTVIGDSNLNVPTTVGGQPNPARAAGTFDRGFTGAIDGMAITGGAQQGFPTNINTTNGGTTTPVGGAGALVTQGGGIYVHSRARRLQLSNNLVVGNGGSYGGGIRIGTPYTAVEGSPNSWTVPATDANVDVKVLHNRLTDNGGTNLAGGIGIFDGSDNYVVDHNDVCGNGSSEYGGGISHYGLSDGGRITFNRVYLNNAYDEGGGIMVAGELNPNVDEPSAGAAHSTSSLTIDGNTVERNLSNDDGGGIRFLNAGRVAIGVTNNFVDNNISTHEGGGLALADSTNVSIVGNTVMNNITTATAITSDGTPAPAGLSTSATSDQLQALVGTSTGTPLYSKPTLRGNIFRGNLAGSWNPVTQVVDGISGNSPRVWEVGSVEPLRTAGNTALDTITSTASVYDTDTDVHGQVTWSGANIDPSVKRNYSVGVVIETSRAFPSFRQAVIVAALVAPDAAGDYHLNAGSPARGIGGAASAFPSVAVYPSTTATRHDVDNGARPDPAGSNVDAGADEIP